MSEMHGKVANRADLWYNEALKTFVTAVLQIPRDRIHSLEECIMDTLPPHALTPQERKKAYNKAYYQAHHAEIREQQKSYRESHTEEIKTYGQSWRESHREYAKEYARLNRQVNGDDINARRRQAYQTNPEPKKSASIAYARANRAHVSTRQKLHRQANREKYNARCKQYRQANPEKTRSMFKGIKARRRTRLTQAGGSYTISEWQTLKTQYDHMCLCCGRKEPAIKLTADHVIPVSRGGDSFITNIQPLCGSCNSKKHDKVIDYRVRFQK